ncbi:Predicted protein [Paenibacillus sophorae]|uniref:DUF2271 domain-containing protein n=1 Tax=Paenibacillus sophorae TaxID=1333845 RepID=A0A1H8RU52_9BACL|nr:DUF2271 domain-containing protein [Paenibacillus sophorae]QWU16978.1 DUF2271 domain-containing protein [Paenibacillus sophorae]SEO69872.1 Predicted protein [Paenibacillus sophorae]
MKKIKGAGLLLSALLLVLLGAACGGGGPEATSSQPANSLSGAAVSPSPAASPGGSSAAGEHGQAAGSAQPGDVRRTLEISFPFVRQDGIATNQFAVWIEDGSGRFVNTLYATRFIATGGYKLRPEAIPTWVEHSGLAQASPEEADAVSGATLSSGQLKFAWDCKDQDGNPVPDGTYRFYVEGTTRWENRILYEGTIAVGKERTESEADVKYTTDEAAQSGMIGQVTAVYMP